MASYDFKRHIAHAVNDSANLIAVVELPKIAVTFCPNIPYALTNALVKAS